MAHHTQQVLTTLAAVALLGLALTGCTATWSGEISIDVHYPGRPAAVDRTGPKTTMSYSHDRACRTTEYAS